MSRFIQPAGSYQAAASVTAGASDLPGGVASALLVLSVGGGTTATIETANGTSLSLTGLTVNTVLPIATRKVTAAAATLVALY